MSTTVSTRTSTGGWKVPKPEQHTTGSAKLPEQSNGYMPSHLRSAPAVPSSLKTGVPSATQIEIPKETKINERPDPTVFSCNFPGCDRSFRKKKYLDQHKDTSDDHDYCRKCDLDFDSWEAMVAHKSKKHRACKHCGREFHSEAGLQAHYKQVMHDWPLILLHRANGHQNHPIEQDIKCKGCKETFTRAAALMSHLENGECISISKSQFAAHLQHKHIINKLLADPTAANHVKAKDFTEVAKMKDTESSAAGGVAIEEMMDDHDDLEGVKLEIDHPAMTPEKKARPPHDSLASKGFPALPPGTASERMLSTHSGSTGGVSLRSPVESGMATPSKGKVEMDHNALAARFASLNARIEASRSGDQSTGRAEETFDEQIMGAELAEIEARITREQSNAGSAVSRSSSQIPSGPWSSLHGTSKSLFPNAKSSPITTAWATHLENIRDEEAHADRNNMLRLRFWHPEHQDYDPDRLYNPLIERYCCPFPFCGENFKQNIDLSRHITSIHRITDFRCPSCLRLFKSATALVAHCETASARCRISGTRKFGQVIDEFSGGFLEVKGKKRPDLNRFDDGFELGYNKYDASTPVDWDRSEEGPEKHKSEVDIGVNLDKL